MLLVVISLYYFHIHLDVENRWFLLVIQLKRLLNEGNFFIPLSSSVRASQGSLVSFSLLRLLHCLLSKSSQVSVAAYTQIRALATTKGLKLQTLFSQYKNPICQVSSLLFKLDQTPSYSPAYYELDDLLYNTVIHSIYVDLMFENCIGLVFIWSVLDTVFVENLQSITISSLPLVPGGVTTFAPCVSPAEHTRSRNRVSQSEGAGSGYSCSDRACFWLSRPPPLPHRMYSHAHASTHRLHR